MGLMNSKFYWDFQQNNHEKLHFYNFKCWTVSQSGSLRKFPIIYWDKGFIMKVAVAGVRFGKRSMAKFDLTTVKIGVNLYFKLISPYFIDLLLRITRMFSCYQKNCWRRFICLKVGLNKNFYLKIWYQEIWWSGITKR